jgi:hypothetical protein
MQGEVNGTGPIVFGTVPAVRCRLVVWVVLKGSIVADVLRMQRLAGELESWPGAASCFLVSQRAA